MNLPSSRKPLPNRTYVSLSEALTWVAFNDAMPLEELRAQVQGHASLKSYSEEQVWVLLTKAPDNQPEVPGIGHFKDRVRGLERLTEAWGTLRNAVDRGTVHMRGRYSSRYDLEDARLADVKDLTGQTLATFSQFDVSTGGIRRQTHKSAELLWEGHPRGFAREFDSFGDDVRKADGYLLIEVERAGLLRAIKNTDKRQVPSNRQIDHEAVIRSAADMLKARPGLTKGSAAASIVVELQLKNPKTGKLRDTRHIERLIGHLWDGGEV